ncbi:MAG TPA: LUD domain-containing protein [Candidatus Angelobacter sp.]|nr:LUD domain-containing protein [Candidatus Angelobacter sp.]
MNNQSAKSAILSRIRGAIGADPANTADREALRLQEWPEIPREFRRKGTLPPQERVTLLQAILKHYGATSYLAGLDNVAAVVAQVLQERKKKRLVVPREFPSQWIPPGMEAVPDTGLSHSALNNDQIDGVLTGCTVAIASTGTIVLASGRDGRRALTLVPDYQICVVLQDQIVEFIAEALEVLQPIKTLPLTFFSGPSATVDIEMTRVQGVHGPRTLDVVIAS